MRHPGIASPCSVVYFIRRKPTRAQSLTLLVVVSRLADTIGSAPGEVAVVAKGGGCCISEAHALVTQLDAFSLRGVDGGRGIVDGGWREGQQAWGLGGKHLACGRLGG